ncbi:MAG: hypothetical protein AB7P11_20385 [Hydrogenophaga sp.]|uniref:hypothetical protein n=1 Tax=Hydrogenophaga sp. TaxID=1904254 RepID=UPI003D0D026E
MLLLDSDLRVLHRHHRAVTHLPVTPVQEAHRLAQVQVLAHRQDSLGIGQHPLDDGAQLEQLQAAGPPQHLQQPGVDAGQAHAAILCG